MADLSSLLTELGDYRGIVQLYEDQILRGKDVNVRAELARKVARMWEQELADPREAADAWRRVLRMKQGDPEATAGLDRAKADMLKRPEPREADGEREDGAARGAAPAPAPAVAAGSATPAADELAHGLHGASSESGTRAPGSNGARGAPDRAAAHAAPEAPPSSPPSDAAVHPVETRAGEPKAALADDLAEAIDVELDEGEELPPEQDAAKDAANDAPKDAPKDKPAKKKRSVPPPLPRA